MEIITQARDLYFRQFRSAKTDAERFNVPFPIAVFGTLRHIPENQGNGWLMHQREPIAHKRAFLPHFSSSGISLFFKEGAAGLFEAFFYTPEDWADVIPAVDRLESFRPTNPARSYYQRTLVEIMILPNDHSEESYQKSIRHWDDRDLRIPSAEWDYPRIPAWVYSNHEANEQCLTQLSPATSPILWWPASERNR